MAAHLALSFRPRPSCFVRFPPLGVRCASSIHADPSKVQSQSQSQVPKPSHFRSPPNPTGPIFSAPYFFFGGELPWKRGSCPSSFENSTTKPSHFPPTAARDKPLPGPQDHRSKGERSKFPKVQPDPDRRQQHLRLRRRPCILSLPVSSRLVSSCLTCLPSPGPRVIVVDRLRATISNNKGDH